MTEKSLDAIAFGAAIVDILARVDDAFLTEHNIAKGAMTLVEGDRAEAIHSAMPPGAREISGGSAANTIVGMASLGSNVAFGGKIKDDAIGKIFSDDMARIGVAFDTPRFGAHAPGHTARSMILVTPDAERSMCTDLGVSALLRTDDLPMAAIEDSKIVYLEGYLWDHVETKRAFSAAMEAGHAAGAEIALTLSDTFCVERHRDSFLELIHGQVEVLFANEAELLSLYETDDFEQAVAKIDKAVRLAAVTRSEKGCVVLAQGERFDIQAEKIPHLADTTGAGDLFAAGFLFGVANGRDPETCGKMGCLAASEVIQHIGARPERDLKEIFAPRGFL
ncbi:MAG: adenosine kinase [Neomegalonema sp.]|nr:adenosine kinase [Neomegalonema sp.]